MNTRQVKKSKQATTVTLFPSPSSAGKKIPDNWFGISVLHLQTLRIPTITSQQQKQITDNPLTERELFLLQMIADGKSNLAIAEELSMKVGTVKTHLCKIFRKLNVRGRTQATIIALRSGLVN